MSDTSSPETDPLAGDWSEGLPPPARALGIPEPRRISMEGMPAAPVAAQSEAPVAEVAQEEAEAPDAWATGEDPLSQPPPPAEVQPSVIVDITPSMPSPAFLPDVTPSAPAPAFLPDVTPSSPAPMFDAAPDAAPQEEQVEQVMELGEADESHEMVVQSEIEAAEPIVDTEEPVVELSPEDAWEDAAQTAAAKAPDWDAAPAAPATEEWTHAAIAPAQPAPAAPAPDWGALSSGPDWSAPVAAPSADAAWTAPTDASWASDATAWGSTAPAAPPADAAWAAPAVEAPRAPEWQQTNNTLMQMEGEPEPIAADPNAARELFGTVPAGGSLTEESEDELPDAEEVADDPDLPVAIPEPEVAAPTGLTVPGEHRVAIHTRGGSTKRGMLRDVDLSQSDFALLPQGESIQHSEVKAIFFMLPPGGTPRPGGHGKVKITFADGRSIEGERDGEESPHGFFIVPSDAARTNTWRIYIAREATSEIKDL